MKYRTIVVDPPWEYERTGFSFGEKHSQGKRNGKPRRTRPPYPMLSEAEIAGMPVSDLSEDDAHLYLWTTQRYLRASFSIVEAWGFSVSTTLVWCKAPMGMMGGAFRSSTEFCQFARRGRLAHNTQASAQWFTWPRSGYTQTDPVAAHSAKPEAFLDLVEQVSPGPYLEMFARRARFGWDYYGDESLQTVELVNLEH